MAYPYQISTVCYLPDPKYTPGPYDYNDNRYVVLQEHPTPTNLGGATKVRVFKSTDQGQTWAEQDSGNAKTFYQSDTNSPIDTYWRGSTLYVTYVPSVGAALSIAPFDMATDTWGTVITSGPTPGDNLAFKSFVLSTGDIRTVFSDLTGGSRIRVKIATYSGGSWGSSTTLFDPGVSESTTLDYRIMGAVLDKDDNIGILCHTAAGSSTTTSMRYRHYSAAGSSGTYKFVPYLATTKSPPPLSGPPCTIPTTSGDSLFVFPAFTKYTANLLQPGVIIVDPGSNPPGIRFASVFDPTSDLTSIGAPSAFGFPFSSSFYVTGQSALFLYWAYFDGATEFKIKRACTKLVAGWNGPGDAFATGALTGFINNISAQVVGASSDRVGIAFDAWQDNANPGSTYRTPYYYEEDLPTCAADGCPSSSTARNRYSIR